MPVDCLLLVLILGLAGVALIVAIAALRRMQRPADSQDVLLTQLLQRVERLENELRQARQAVEARAVEQPPLAMTAAPVEAPPAASATAVPAMEAEALAVEIDTQALEEWIGRRWLGWIAVVLLLFAVAFFLKYAFENQWIGELGRVSLGILAGVAMCGSGLHFHRKEWRIYSQMLSAGGVMLLYLATYGSFGYYRLISQTPAGLFLVILVVEAAALAICYEAPSIALMAVIGGLLNPVLLHTDRDQYVSLFSYLAVLNAGVVGLALVRPWRGISSVALLGTQWLFWLWYNEHYHPEKLGAALAFQSVLFGLSLLQTVLAHGVRRRTASVEDLVRLVANGFLFALASYVLLDPDYHDWLATFFIAVAVVYAVVAWFLLRSGAGDQRLVLVTTALAMAFVAAAIPLQAKAVWIPVGWAVQGAVLWRFGLRIRAEAVRTLGAVLLALAVCRLAFVDTPDTVWQRRPFVPLFNKYAIPASVVMACLGAAAWSSRRFLGRLGQQDRPWMLAAGLSALALGWLVLSVEVSTFFLARIPAGEEARHWQRAASTSLSVAWAIYAAVLVAIGLRRHIDALRWSALVVFAATLLKVVLHDTAGLSGLYRVLAFFMLSVMLGAAAWGYQKLQFLTKATARR